VIIQRLEGKSSRVSQPGRRPALNGADTFKVLIAGRLLGRIRADRPERRL